MDSQLDQAQARSYSIARWMLAIVAFGTVLAMCTVTEAPQPPYLRGHSSRDYGYTISLALFLVPILGFIVAFRRSVGQHWAEKMKALWVSAVYIVVLWSLLDVLLGNAFFAWPNPKATLPYRFLGWSSQQGWSYNIPLEEFAFYISGFLAILMTYIWANNFWLRPFLRDPEPAAAITTRGILRPPFHYKPFSIGAVLFLAALAYKKLWLHETGFPGYFLFVLTLIIVPSFLLLPKVAPQINVHSLVFTMQALLLTSLLWEATLAMPYGWWSYNESQMIGIFIRPWYNLPVEAPLVWISATWMNIVFYETIKLYYISQQRPFTFLFGSGESTAQSPAQPGTARGAGGPT